MNLTSWILALVPSLTRQILLSLGMGLMTITGISVAWSQVQSAILSDIGSLPSSVLGLAGLCGAGDAIGIMLGAIVARVTLSALINSSRIIGLSK
jgi:hypothetical protein